MVQSADWINRARSIERIDQATEQDQLRSTERIVRTIEFLIAKAIVNPDRDPLNRPDNEESSDCKRLIKECDRVSHCAPAFTSSRRCQSSNQRRREQMPPVRNP